MTAQPSALLESLLSNIDIDAFEDVPTGLLTLLDPRTGAKTTSTITLASPDHPARRSIDMQRSRRLRQTVAATGKIPVSEPLEEIEEETDYLVAATLEWNLTAGGKSLPFSKDAARALYTDPKRQWLRRQVKEALNKQDLFLRSDS